MRSCTSCGQMIDDGARTCINCGAEQPYPDGEVDVVQPPVYTSSPTYSTAMPLREELAEDHLLFRPWVMYLCLIVLPLAPWGLFLLWRDREIPRWIKALTTAFYGFMALWLLSQWG